MNRRGQAEFGAIVVLVLVVGLFGVGGCFACPVYNVWSAQKEGEAELAKAEFSKRVAVQEALAKKDSAQNLADAEVTRARGVATANEIIGKSLSGNEAYLRYLWIQTLGSGNSEVVYVPTEANLPILEAGKKAQSKP